jgi:hypothetical protein
MVILLVHIVHVRGQAGLGHATQFQQHPNRQTRGGDDSRAGSLRASHPARYRQRPAIGPPHDKVNLIVEVVLPDHRQAM